MTRAAATSIMLAALAALPACGSSGSDNLERDIDRSALGGQKAVDHARLIAEGDALWRERGAPARLAAALARWEQAVRVKDDDWRTYAKLAQGYYFQADAEVGFAAMRGDYPFDMDYVVDRRAAARYRGLLARGYRAALRGMAARSREFEVRLQAGVSVERAIQVLGKDSAALVYWYIANLAASARTEGRAALFANRGRIISSIYHLRRIDPAYQYGGADRFLGIYYAAAPALLGGDVERSQAHFAAALRAAPAYLGNAVWAAQTLDRRKKDRAGFEAALRGVLAAPDGPPELAPDNQLEKRKAERLLRRLDRWFPKRR
jgi:hypothetical protein